MTARKMKKGDFAPMVIPAGTRYGWMTTLETKVNTKGRVPCKCDCGAEKLMSVGYMRATRAKGALVSCGCSNALRTHGKSQTREYATWLSMRNRCTKPSQQCYKNYGGRGISVCDRWQKFEHFYADMGPKPSPKHTIDRLNNDGNYEPSNCAWRTRKENMGNRRRTRRMTLGGVTKTLSEWSDLTGISTNMIRTRLIDMKWLPEDVILTPPDAKRGVKW